MRRLEDVIITHGKSSDRWKCTPPSSRNLLTNLHFSQELAFNLGPNLCNTEVRAWCTKCPRPQDGSPSSIRVRTGGCCYPPALAVMDGVASGPHAHVCSPRGAKMSAEETAAKLHALAVESFTARSPGPSLGDPRKGQGEDPSVIRLWEGAQLHAPALFFCVGYMCYDHYVIMRGSSTFGGV